MARVLVACEESQAVTSQLRRRGVEAFSCDLLPTSGRHPEWHLQVDALEACKLPWDMVLAFPPCTHLAVSGAAWFEEKRRDGRQQMAAGFFLAFTALDHVPMVAIENPVGVMSNLYRKPDQIVHPWMFGDPHEKKTCLWLKALPKLEPTRVVEPNPRIELGGKSYPDWHTGTKSKGEAGRSERSKTFPGLALAMATQWGRLLEGLP